MRLRHRFLAAVGATALLAGAAATPAFAEGVSEQDILNDARPPTTSSPTASGRRPSATAP
jgi:alcohol dehydrogenase (cytochrome c)